MRAGWRRRRRARLIVLTTLDLALNLRPHRGDAGRARAAVARSVATDAPGPRPRNARLVGGCSTWSKKQRVSFSVPHARSDGIQFDFVKRDGCLVPYMPLAFFLSTATSDFARSEPLQHELDARTVAA